MPFFILGHYRKEAVIYLTAGGDLGHVAGCGYESITYGACRIACMVIPRVPPRVAWHPAGCAEGVSPSERWAGMPPDGRRGGGATSKCAAVVRRSTCRPHGCRRCGSAARPCARESLR